MRRRAGRAGCELYIPCRDPEDSGSYLFYEQYRDKAAFEEHGASEHFQRLGAGELFGLMESRERVFYETVGELRRGALLAALFLGALALRPQLVGIGPLIPSIQLDLNTSHAVVGLLGRFPSLHGPVRAAGGRSFRGGSARATRSPPRSH